MQLCRGYRTADYPHKTVKNLMVD